MPAPKVEDSTFVHYCKAYGFAATAQKLGVSERAVHSRRRRLEAVYGAIESPVKVLQERSQSAKARRSAAIEDGVLLCGSDFHFWPGIIPTAHAGMVHFAKKWRKNLAGYVWNGDIFDGASISRHARIGWEYQPSVADELECVRARADEVADATTCTKWWMLGNHDARFETRIAAELPQFEKVQGVHLKDHFPEWETGWSLFVNDTLVIKHRYKGGLHAQFNNAMWSGKSIMVGHDHKGIIYPFTDYNGTRYGIGLPVGAEPQGPQFVDYTEDNPLNHRSGFCVITFKDGRMMQPELAFVVETGVIEFRGEWVEVGI